jgi:Ca-activated chloride channel family protein
MTFLWPKALWLLLLLPAAAAAYVLILRRHNQAALHYTNLAMVKAAIGGTQRIRRHVPAALFLAALAAMLVALAHPAAVVTLPTQHDTVILAIDVSGSMRADDVKPTRLAAAQAAAKAFVKDTPRSTRIGIVAFAGSAAIVQPPTSKRDAVYAAIEQLQLDYSTAVGSGILASLKAIFPEQEFGPWGGNASPVALGEAKKEPPAPVPPGSYKEAAIVLLTDGQTTSGPDPVAAARLAAARGVRVFTVGVGTADGQILSGEGWSVEVRLDEDALKVIADLTRGDYFLAGNAPDLTKIYEGLTSRLVLEKQETEITALFAGLAAALSLLAAALSLLWFKRVL